MAYPQYFNFGGRRYYKSVSGCGTKKAATDRAAEMRKKHTALLWRVHQEEDGKYSVGHAAKKKG